MLLRRLAELRTIERQLRKCTRELSLAKESLHDALRQPEGHQIASPRSTSGLSPSQIESSSIDASRGLVSKGTLVQDAKEAVQSISGVRSRILLRHIPIALSRLERLLKSAKPLNVGRLTEVAGSSSTQFPAPPSPSGTMSDTFLNDLLFPSSSEDNKSLAVDSSPPEATGGANLASLEPLPLQPDKRLLTRWGGLITGQSSARKHHSVCVGTQHAAQLISSLHYAETQRVEFLTQERNSLKHAIATSAQQMSNRKRGLQRELSSSKAKLPLSHFLQTDIHFQDQLRKHESSTHDLELLDQTIVTRPYVSALMWQAILEPEFVDGAFGVASSDPRVVAQQLDCCLGMCRLTLSLLKQYSLGEPINKSSPRFVVSLPSRSRRASSADPASKIRIRWLPRPASDNMALLRLQTLRALSRGFSAQLTTSDGSNDHVIAKHAERTLEILMSLHKVTSVVIALTPQNDMPELSVILRSLDKDMSSVAHAMIRNANEFVEGLSPSAAARGLVGLHEIGVLDINSRDSQIAIAMFLMKTYPMLSTQTHRKLTARAIGGGKSSIFEFVTKAHKSKLRRKHHALTKDAIAAALENTIHEQRLQSRQIAAALRERQLTEFYKKNVANVMHLPLLTIVNLFHVAVMTATAPSLPLPAAETLSQAACITAEALLWKSSKSSATRLEDRLDVLVSVLMSSSGLLLRVLSLADASQRDAGSAAAMSNAKRFSIDFCIYLLRSVASIAAAQLRDVQETSRSDDDGGKISEIVMKIGPHDFVRTLEVVVELHPVAKEGSSLKEELQHTTHLLKSILVNFHSSWRQALGKDKELSRRLRSTTFEALSLVNIADDHTMNLLT